MPVTPLHIGVPGLISYYFPKRIDIISAIIGSIIIDIDFFILIIFGTPIHGIFHTFFGATILSIFLIIIIKLSGKLTIKLKNWFKWEIESDLISISLGAFIGTYSHIILDSLIYNDMNPFYPITGNPLFLENGQPTIFYLVYSAAIITTLLFLILFCWRYIKSTQN